MGKIIGYSPVSIFATCCGSIATAAVTANPFLAVSANTAVGIGTAVSTILSGVELSDKEKNIREKLDRTMGKAWDEIENIYRLSPYKKCLSELKQEVMGEQTSVEEFIRNLNSKGLEPSIAMVIQSILNRYKDELKKDSEINWDDKYIEEAASDIAARLVKAIKAVFEDDNQLRLLKEIADSTEVLLKKIEDKGNQIINEFYNYKSSDKDIPAAITTIPVSINLIGRKKDIQNIYILLEEHDIVAIHADGGVGKTAIAAKIANDIRKNILSGNSSFEHIAWITSTGNLKEDIIGLNLPAAKAVDSQEEKFSKNKAFLEKTPTFLVIDNMDEPPTRDEVNELSTISGRTKILITTRADIPISESYELKDLDSDSALALFYLYYRKKRKLTIDQIKAQEDFSFAQSIVEAATHNSLFVELIAKMAYADHWKLDALWKELEHNVFGKDSKHAIVTGHGDDGKLLAQIQKLYTISSLSDKQKEIMEFIALFPAEQIVFFDVFEWAGFEDNEDDALEELRERGWIERGDDGYIIHTLVKGSIVLQRMIVFDEEKYENLINELSETDQYIQGNMAYSKIQERFVISETICRLLLDKGSEKKNTVKLYNNMGVLFRNKGMYSQALIYYHNALAILKKVFGMDYSDIATTYNNIATVHYAQGDFNKALMYYQKALIIQEKEHETDHPDTAMTYNNLASLYVSLGDYSKALLYYQKALAIKEKTLGKGDLSTATTYGNIANVYLNEGFVDEAMVYFKKALEIREKELGEEHPVTATTYGNIARVYSAHGAFDDALTFHKKALAIQEKVLGTEHQDTATTYGNIGEIYLSQGAFDEAMLYYQKALAIKEKVLGMNHPNTATTYGNIAAAYFNQRAFDKAMVYFQKALTIQEEQLGTGHPDTASTYVNIALIYFAQNAYDEAMSYFQKALEIQEKILGAENPDTAVTYSYIAMSHSAKGAYEEAMAYYKKSLAVLEKTYGPRHSSTLMIYNNLGALFYYKEDYKSGKYYFEKAYSGYKHLFGNSHPHTKSTKEWLDEIMKKLNS